MSMPRPAPASDRNAARVSDAPDFFLVGAPKCATSSLHMLLIRHGRIFMCSPKEPHFFCPDLPGLSEVADRAAYDALFADAPADALLGEASAFYLMSAEAPAQIYAANPEARIILSLRNPADAARSLYHQLRDGFREDRPTFQEAWALQADRARGQSLPPYCPEPRQLQYREVYSYADQVARYLEMFGPDQVLVLRFEEIAQDPSGVVSRVLDFLDLPDFDEPVSLPRTNTRREPRFPGLSQFIAAPPFWIRPLVSPAKRVLNAIGIKPSVVMMNHLSRPAEPKTRTDTDTQFRAEIITEFSEDIARLEALIGADLSAWRN
ncbi:sulfotransferase [Gymnodinialimonas sp. 2305UL16-5]|uniref:sulfotransferase n=1 Tax=Gymnodinialimonas mytili TaxID=3126503 RepID=UPI0030A6BA9D